jgi:hypothetical protein
LAEEIITFEKIMLFSITLFLFWLFLFTWWIWKGKIFDSVQISRKALLLGFYLKLAASLFFIGIFSKRFGSGELTMDSGIFFVESKMLYNIFFQSPIDYLKLLTGIGENKELIFKYLQDTDHWDSGSLSIINDAKNVIRVNSVFMFFSNGFIYTHGLFLSLITFFGIVKLAHAVSQYIKYEPRILFFTLLLYPSLCFWSGGILKEPFLISGIGLLMFALLINLPIKTKVLYFIISFFFLFCFKPYVVFVLIFSIGMYFLTLVFKKHNPILIVSSFFLVLIVTLSPNILNNGIVVHLSKRQLDFDNLGRGGVYFYDQSRLYRLALEDSLNYKLEFEEIYLSSRYVRKDTVVEILKDLDCEAIFPGQKLFFQPTKVFKGQRFYVDETFTSGASYFKSPKINYSYWRLIWTTPFAISNAILRPFPLDRGGAMKYPAMLEVFLLVAFLIFAIIKKRKLNKEENRFLISVLVFALLLAALIGQTVSISGALVRYRIPVYMALICVGFILLKPSKRYEKK